MSGTIALGQDDATRFMRVLGPDEQLMGVKMVPMAGNTLVPLSGLADAETFLKPISTEEAAGMSMNMRIHYVDPNALAAWVRDTVGDSELASGLTEVASTGRAFGLLVPEMKQLIADRIAEYRAVLEEQEHDSGI